MAEDAAESPRQIFRREDLGGRAVIQHRSLYQHRPVAEFRHGAEVVSRDKHHPSFIAQRFQEGDDRRLGFHIHASERFIQQDDPRVLRQRAGEEDALALATRKLPDLALPVGGHPHPLQRRINRRPVIARRAAEKAHMAIAAHHHHVFDKDGKGPVDLLRLRNIGNQIAPDRLRHRLTEDAHAPFARFQKAHDRLEHGGLAGPVHADKRGDRPFRRLKAGVFQRHMAVAVGDGDTLNRKTPGGRAGGVIGFM